MALANAISISLNYPDRPHPELQQRDEATIRTLSLAESYWVSGQIWEAIVTSSIDMPMDFQFSEDMAPTPHGWLWLNKPWLIPQSDMAHSKEARSIKLAPAASAIMWGVGISAVSGAPVLAIETFHGAWNGQLVPLFYTFTHPTNTLQQEEDRRRNELRANDRVGDEVASGAVMRAVLSAFLWLKQTICVAKSTPMERHVSKRLSQLDIEKALHVITLRRAESRSDRDVSGEPVEWSCRWLVRGHWRQQYYPSTGKHAPVYVLPHVKGPEDKPIRVAAPTVFAVKR